jgi:hypothetical protein
VCDLIVLTVVTVAVPVAAKTSESPPEHEEKEKQNNQNPDPRIPASEEAGVRTQRPSSFPPLLSLTYGEWRKMAWTNACCASLKIAIIKG